MDEKMTVKEQLQEVRKVIKGGWTQSSYMKDANGEKIFDKISDSRGVFFCISGAVAKVVDFNINKFHLPSEFRVNNDIFPNSEEWLDLMRILASANGQDKPLDLEKWNDDGRRTQQDVLNLIDKAIGTINVR